ncbi:response regulator transcription factor [Nocardioides plantarum]|uniref:LuxR C-terminal-related transcriptional regulator n=1 Tax=Nocardioides plantarum TaxID=29299 RepID=A0ABV5KCU6_9ACTN|nr:response regulator transcription factor [Nocardioides plantarum]
MPPEPVTRAAAPVRIALAPDAPIVAAGLAAIVAGELDIALVELPTEGAGFAEVDLVLYDPVHEVPESLRGVAAWNRPPLVAFSWSVRADTVTRARAQGAIALLSKDLEPWRLLRALRAVHRGDLAGFTVTVDDDLPARRRSRRPDGLTARELEMLELITRGLSNEEIASSLYLSINSVKTYIRTAYRKIGVNRRPQAVLWGVHHGFGADASVGARR